MELLILIILVSIIILYSRYYPKIDIVLSHNKTKVLLWYSKYSNGYCSRAYIELFEI